MSSAATKRDSKAYITRLKTDPSTSLQAKTCTTPEKQTVRPEVNLGTFFGHARAVEQRPQFSQYTKDDNTAATYEQEAHHLALVKLVGPEKLEDAVLQGIGVTLSQLCRLSMTPCVVLDCVSSIKEHGQFTLRQEIANQADRLEQAIRRSSGLEARTLHNVYSLSETASLPTIFSRNLLMAPIRSGKIPIILPLAYSNEIQTIMPIAADQAILALAKEFAGLNAQSIPDEDPATTTRRFKDLQRQASLDRLIILDPQGGIPHPREPGSVHVFLNMEQEYYDVRKELLNHIKASKPRSPTQRYLSDEDNSSSLTSSPHPMSSRASQKRLSQDVLLAYRFPSLLYNTQGALPDFVRHVDNLDLSRDVLAYLPPSSSALVTTPLEAARSSKTGTPATTVSAVGTRMQKNPLIHNLLTDRPAYSASLPMGRLGQSNTAGDLPLVVATSTFVKRGMPLTIIPDPRIAPWTSDHQGEPKMKLTDPRIDLSRLVYLIDDSFNRKLDVKHYLERVNDRIAGLIIAGEYEGGALFTWETPPGVAPSDLTRQVPYLDKFAVLKRSQGAGGVADIVFNAMVRGCFPDGVCWRSRRDNPVNKWYFERARGTWKLPATNWTMFWTTEGVETGVGEKFKDYEAVCRGVEPSWIDKKKVAD